MKLKTDDRNTAFHKSRERDLTQSTWASFCQGERLKQAEIKTVFAFDFSDLFPHMLWDDTSKTQ